MNLIAYLKLELWKENVISDFVKLLHEIEKIDIVSILKKVFNKLPTNICNQVLKHLWM
jgi:hypothetical protein